MSHLLLWGNAYAQVIRDGRGQVLALYPLLQTRWKSTEPHLGTSSTPIGGSWESRLNPDHGTVTLRRDDVLHIPVLALTDWWLQPLAMAKNAIGMALATEEYGATFFANGANPVECLNTPASSRTSNG